MKSVLKLIATTLPAGLLAAYFWSLINGFGRQNGVGILERQVWPLNDIYSCAGIAVCLAILSMSVFEFLTTKRSNQLEAAGSMLGLKFGETLSKKSLSIKGRLPLFDHWDEACNLLEGTVDGIQLQVFDYASVVTRRSAPGKDNSTQRDQQTVILIPFDNDSGPSFSMRRRNSLFSISSLLGFDGLSFEGDQTLSIDDQDQIRQFNENYLVMQPNGEATGSSNGAKSQQIADQISLSLLKKLLDGQGWSLDVCESHAVFWVNSKRFKPGELSQVINESLQLFPDLASGNSTGPSLRVSGEPNLSGPISFTNFGPVIASGCFGMVLAFGLFVPIFFMFAEQAPWLVFVWPFFGMVIIAICVLLGSKIARKKR